MKVSHTIIAVVILLALGGVFYYLNQQPAETATSSSNEPPKKKVFAFEAGQVDEFTIEAPNQPATTVRRAAAPASVNRMRISQPSRCPYV